MPGLSGSSVMRANVETEVVVRFKDDPGVPARAGEALGEAGVNIYGYACNASGGSGAVSFLTAEPTKALEVLEAEGFSAEHRRVIVTPAPHEPGAFGRIARQFAAKGITVTDSYLVLDPSNTLPRLAFAVEASDGQLESVAARIRS